MTNRNPVRDRPASGSLIADLKARLRHVEALYLVSQLRHQGAHRLCAISFEGAAMTIGRPGADSSNLVTRLIHGKPMVDVAAELFGQMPVLWGRYFTSVATSGLVEYRARRENQALRDRNIRVLPIARQTKHVDGTLADGNADAQLNVEDLIKTFSASYLQSQGGKFLMFLDVEGTPSLSTDYYLGWARTLVDHSQSFSKGAVTILPGVYATQSDDATWRAVAEASQRGVQSQGAWIARWRRRGCATPLDWDPDIVLPRVNLPCEVLLWQYADECHGGDGFDCNETNPNIDLQDILSLCVLPPDTPVA